MEGRAEDNNAAFSAKEQDQCLGFCIFSMAKSRQGLQSGNIEYVFQADVGCNSCQLRCPFRISLAVMCFAEERLSSKAEVPSKESQEEVTTVSGNENLCSLFCMCTFFLPLFSCLFHLLL